MSQEKSTHATFFVLGSLNIDEVYNLPNVVRVGETISAISSARYPGGKGANQSVSLAKAGETVYHAGKIGPDGKFLVDTLTSFNVNTDLVDTDSNATTGRAIIQVSASGENAIVLDPGANMAITSTDVERYMRFAMSKTSGSAWLVLQNEVTPSAIRKAILDANAKGMRVALNPAPCPPDLDTLYPLDKVDVLILNEIEAADLYGSLFKVEAPEDMIAVMEAIAERLPTIRFIVITQGSKGVFCRFKNADGAKFINVPALSITPVDTTAAGDTFVGYFLAHLSRAKDDSESSVQYCLSMATVAAAITCERKGAISAIPSLAEVQSRSQQ
ncbi:hypothetical protein HDU67_003320 [Dinochytrium kinnereticum]|nr:hypothetical protein HDU67_003320 [Dinochytrium kinnereticum]